MKLKYTQTIFLIVLGFSLSAQTFSPAFRGWSKKKPTYVTTNNGEEVAVYIKKLKFKKGLIDELKVVKASDSKKVKIKPEEISHMYVAPSALAKINQAVDAATDLTKLQDDELSLEHLDDGYMYMEASDVQVKKKKTQYCMLQVLNPTFSKEIKVYNDPWAKTSAGIGIGGIKLAGGLDKSYYIKKKGEDIARKIRKKDFRKDMNEIFSDCPDLLAKYGGDSPKWSEFETFIFDYSTMCK